MYEGEVVVFASGNPLKTSGRSNRAKTHRALIAEAPAMAELLERIEQDYVGKYRALSPAANIGDENAFADGDPLVQAIRALLARVKGEG